jgi:hypothetical protein
VMLSSLRSKTLSKTDAGMSQEAAAREIMAKHGEELKNLIRT